MVDYNSTTITSSPLMPSSLLQADMLANLVYQTALFTGLLIGYAKVTKIIVKSASAPRLDFDGYYIGMLILDI